MKDSIPEFDAVPVDERNELGRPLSTRRPGEALEDIVASAREFAVKIPATIGRAIDRAMQAGEHTLLIRVDDEMLRNLDMLIEAGIFKNRGESAAFLIAEGIKAQQPLFNQIQMKVAEIDRLRSELKNIVTE